LDKSNNSKKVKMKENNINNYNQVQEQCTIIKPKISTPLLLIKSGIHSIYIGFVLLYIIFSINDFYYKQNTLRYLQNFNSTPVISFQMGLIIFLVVYFIAIIINFFLLKNSLNNTEYKFYSNRVEYYEGFLVKNRKTINYDRISNISQKRGILERMFGLGTIYLDTPGSSNLGHELAMSYLENYDNVYDWINEITQKK